MYLNTLFPKEPKYDKNCPINIEIKSFNQNKWPKNTFWGQNDKHLYSKIPNCYKDINLVYPNNTLYEKDLTRYSTDDPGKILNYHYKIFPHTNISPRETWEYVDYRSEERRVGKECRL